MSTPHASGVRPGGLEVFDVVGGDLVQSTVTSAGVILGGHDPLVVAGLELCEILLRALLLRVERAEQYTVQEQEDDGARGGQTAALGAEKREQPASFYDTSIAVQNASFDGEIRVHGGIGFQYRSPAQWR